MIITKKRVTLAFSALLALLLTIQTGSLVYLLHEFIYGQTLTSSPSVCELLYRRVLITKMLIVHFSAMKSLSLSFSLSPTISIVSSDDDIRCVLWCISKSYRAFKTLIQENLWNPDDSDPGIR